MNYDSLSTASRLWSLYLAGVVEVFVDILFIWKISDRTFSRVSLSYPILKDTVFGGVYGMDETSDFGVCNYCAIERYHRPGTVLGGEQQTSSLTSQVDCPWIRGAAAISCLGGTTG